MVPVEDRIRYQYRLYVDSVLMIKMYATLAYLNFITTFTGPGITKFEITVFNSKFGSSNSIYLTISMYYTKLNPLIPVTKWGGKKIYHELL